MSKYPGRIVTDLAPAGYSVYFNGANSDAVEIANNAAFDFGTSDVTVEAWVNLASTSAIQNLIDCGPSSGSGFTSWTLDITASGFIRFGSYVGGTYQAIEATSNALATNQWYHIAFTRSSGTNRLFVNGAVCTTTGTLTQAINSGGNTVLIGRGKYSGFTRPTTGYFSNVRIVKGVAVYTAAFTPPTQLFNVTGTSLLTCNSPAFVDQSSNAFSITALATPSISTFTPFTAYVPYNPALGASTPGVWTLDEAMQAAATRQWNMYDPSFQNTTLLLHGNGTNAAQNNTFLDSSSNNFTITRNGNTTQGSFSPFSHTGWSNYFNGSSDYLTVANNAALNFGTGDMTIECWVYLNSTSGTQTIAAKWQSANTSWIWQFTSSTMTFYFKATSSSFSWSPVANTWYHLALSRSGTDVKFFVNGVQTGATSTNAGNADSTSIVAIGANNDGPQQYLNGYISNFRIVKGTAVYTANFTPSTTPLTAITNTSLLTCQSNRFIDNSSNAFAITLNGTPSVQAFSPFYPTAAYTPATIGGSGYFDGNGDYLQTASGASTSFGTGDFCVECWFYKTSSAATGGYLVANLESNSDAQWALMITSTGLIRWQGWNTVWLDPSAPAINQWNHVAVCRSGTTLSMFVNGSRAATATNSNNYSATTNVRVGAYASGTDPITGYISSVRIVKGSSVYDPSLTTYTIPTAPLTAITNTSLLCNFTNAGIVDSTAKNVLETVGNAQISTTQSKFGGSSMSFNGTTDKCVGRTSPNLNMGSGDFTVECWVYWAGGSTPYQNFVGSNSSTFAGNATFFRVWGTSAGATLSSKVGIGNPTHDGLSSVYSVNNLSTNTWTHVAATRSNGIIRVFINGNLERTGSSDTSTYDFGDNGICVGQSPWDGANGWYNGYIDDLRITKGVARYTANFTPQTSQWQDQ